MKNHVGLFLISLALAMTGCSSPIDVPASGPKFAGTWKWTSTTPYWDYTETITLSASEIFFDAQSSIVGTLHAIIVDYDEAENHIECFVTSQTGNFSSFSGSLYITYFTYGNLFMFAWSMSDYPPNTTNAGYSRQ